MSEDGNGFAEGLREQYERPFLYPWVGGISNPLMYH